MVNISQRGATDTIGCRLSNGRVIRVLACLSGDYVFGGVEAYLETLYPRLSECGVRMDVFVPGRIASGKRDVFNSYGIDTIECGFDFSANRSSSSRIILYRNVSKRLRKVLSETNYDVLHLNTGVPLASAFILGMAQKCGVPTRIAHSHSYIYLNQRLGIKSLFRNLLRRHVNASSTIKVACSDAAGQYLFGEEVWKTDGMLIKNGINVEEFSFSNRDRLMIREQCGVESDAPVFCHVGRFGLEKNHLFLIDVFHEIKKIRKDAILWLIGGGPSENEVKEKVHALNLDESVLFLGEKRNVGTFLSGADVFLFPSAFEGFGIALIEAECSGISCVCSTRVPESACVDGCNVLRLPLTEGPAIWAHEALCALDSARDNEAVQKVKAAGYDEVATAGEMLRLYGGSLG